MEGEVKASQIEESTLHLHRQRVSFGLLKMEIGCLSHVRCCKYIREGEGIGKMQWLPPSLCCSSQNGGAGVGGDKQTGQWGAGQGAV